MRIISSALSNYWEFQKRKVERNVKFKNIHKGETCIIFGNGASLKYYDLNAIPQTVAISCSFGLLDRRFKNLNVKYNIFSDSYWFYPIVFNDYTDAIQKNYTDNIFKKIISRNKKVEHFVSLTNSLSFLKRPSNVYYWHHFGLKDFSSVDLAGKFSTNSCALDIMLGLARYMGFSKAVLLGCDYLCAPKMEGHFYTNAVPVFGKDDTEYAKRVQKSVGDLDVLVVCPRGVKSNFFQSTSFEEYFGVTEIYQPNNEIIEMADLALLQKAADKKLLWV